MIRPQPFSTRPCLDRLRGSVKERVIDQGGAGCPLTGSKMVLTRQQKLILWWCWEERNILHLTRRFAVLPIKKSTFKENITTWCLNAEWPIEISQVLQDVASSVLWSSSALCCWSEGMLQEFLSCSVTWTTLYWQTEINNNLCIRLCCECLYVHVCQFNYVYIYMCLHVFKYYIYVKTIRVNVYFIENA